MTIKKLFDKYDLGGLYIYATTVLKTNLEETTLQNIICFVETYKRDLWHFVINTGGQQHLTIEQDLYVDRVESLYHDLMKMN